MAEYIERERIEKFFDGIYDCADLIFDPNDHCCAAADCAHCKWRETMNAIKKCILNKECKKTVCLYLGRSDGCCACFATSNPEFAAKDAKGNPLVFDENGKTITQVP